MDDEHFSGAAYRLKDCINVERLERAQIPHVAVDVLGGEPFGSRNRLAHLRAEGDDRHVITAADEAGLTEGRNVLPRAARIPSSSGRAACSRNR